MAKKAGSKRVSRPPTVSSKSSATAARVAEKSDSPSRLEIAKRAIEKLGYALIPVALAVAASINTLWNDFASDDTQQVLNNVFIKDISNLPLAFTSSVWSFVNLDIAMTAQPYYRPLFSTLFMFNHALFGNSAWSWHLVNVLIHAAVTLLVFILCKEITGRKRLACIAACLFAVHPVHAESVAWISGVTDPMMGLFLLSAFYFYLRFKKSGRTRLMILALVLYFFALWSKETAIALPLVIGYCELFYFTESAPLAKRLVRLSIAAGLFALPTLVYFLTRYNAIGTILTQDEFRYPMGAALITMPLALVKYLVLLVVPAGYSYQHYTPLLTTAMSFKFIGPLALIAILTVGIALSRSRDLKLAAVWFIALLAPALAALRHFDPEYLIQERYLYLSSMGFCLAVAMGIEWVAARKLLKLPELKIAAALTVLLVIIWSAAYIAHSRTWHDTISVFRNCVAADPDSAQARAALASTYFFAGKPREAEAETAKALELDPQCVSAYFNLSYFSKQQGDSDKAIDYLEKAIAVTAPDPIKRTNLATLHLNLGLLYSERKDMARAEQNIRRSVELWSRSAGWFHAGSFYFSQRRYEESLAMYEQVLRHVPPKYAPIHFSLAKVYEKLNRLDRARASYEKFLEFAPPDALDRKQVEQRVRQLQNAPR